ncbi:ABC transporter substrate-binding protein [Streptomyces sp. NBC_00237]|uniref:ABC transporter substrate-binding protein n=1 Tax=Streptomyces sp. NBC_00237 TaxID=2975687 RepID=UPI002257C4F8|nr:ABC transporter substrate-binding protein [Streptomyces sp. NBC_00237]MCX5202276.1 ABC transporter substrate-binding protein [Streptomyces sp. NBC_00237]
MQIRKWPTALLTAGLSAGLLTGCGTTSSSGGGSTSGTGQPVTMGMSDEIKATDPASGYDPGSWLLFNNVFQSLLAFPKGGSEPQPEAAQNCAFDTGSTVYRCTLREGLTFSNGNPLTSQDVKYSFERTLKINDPAGPAVMLSTIKSIDTPDDSKVVFHLKVPDATFPSKIASGAGSIVDHRAYPADKLRTDGKADGSGPYRLDSFGKGQAAFTVNNGYRGTAKIKNTGMTLKLFHDDRKALAQALKKGDIDFAYRGLTAKDTAATEAEAVSGDQRLDPVEGSSAEVHHLVFNAKDPVVGKPGVRRAIAYLVDREALVRDVYQSTATPLYSIVPAGINGHNTAFFNRYGSRPQPAKAREALRGEGIKGKVKLTLWATPSRYGPATVEEFKTLAKQLNRSGLFDADVKSVEQGQYEKDIAAGKYGAYVKGWVPDYPDPENFTQPFFGEGNVISNNYENTEITNKLLPASAAAADRGATSEEFNRLQNLVAEDVPLLPLWQGKQYAVARSNVSGLEWTLDTSTVFRFWEISKS